MTMRIDPNKRSQFPQANEVIVLQNQAQEHTVVQAQREVLSAALELAKAADQGQSLESKESVERVYIDFELVNKIGLSLHTDLHKAKSKLLIQQILAKAEKELSSRLLDTGGASRLK
ncbi:MAG: hypothetical protein ACKVOH_01635, partial [Chlamydiales bacterium]